MPSMTRFTFFLLLLLTVTGSAHGLGFDEALQLGDRTPLLQGSRSALAVRTRLDRGLPSQTGNPEIVVSPGLGYGTNTAGGNSTGLALQVSVQQSWNLADLGKARRGAAGQERAVLAVQARAQALELRLAAAQAWLQLWTAQELLKAATREQELATQFVQAIERAATRGVLTTADTAEAEVFQGEAQLRVVALEGDSHEDAAVLARTVALPAEPLPEATGAPPQPILPDAATWRTAIQRAAKLPEVVAKRVHAQAERARAVEISALNGSAMALGGSLQRDGLGATAVLATVGFRWSLFDRGQRQQSQVAESVELADASAVQAGNDAGHRLALSWHEVEHSREREQVLKTKVLAAAQRLVGLRERQFARGATTVFDVLRARRDRLDAERRHIEATGQRTWAEMKAWLLYAELQHGDEAP